MLHKITEITCNVYVPQAKDDDVVIPVQSSRVKVLQYKFKIFKIAELLQGRIQDFKLGGGGGGALKKIARSV